jgi:hypothetical protein
LRLIKQPFLLRKLSTLVKLKEITIN